jgi:simple sugar transport system permease protein
MKNNVVNQYGWDGFSKLRNKIEQFKDVNVIMLAGVTVAVLLVLSLAIGNKFFAVKNFRSMTFQIPEFGFMAFGMAICILAGGIDLSIVSIANLSSVLAGYVILGIANNGGNVWLAILLAFLVALVVATLCGLLNGLLITKAYIFPILATLSTMIFYNGVTMAITSGNTIIGFPEEFAEVSIFKLWGIPAAFIVFVVVTIILSLILAGTFFGKSIYLYGENKIVALFSGMKTHSIVIKTYVLSGLLSGIGGLIMMSRVNSARVGYGETYLLQALLVCVLGGLSTKGGKGKIVGVFLGILVLQMLQSGFTLLGMEPYLKNFIWGAVLIGVMIANYYIDKNRKKIKLPKVDTKSV